MASMLLALGLTLPLLFVVLFAAQPVAAATPVVAPLDRFGSPCPESGGTIDSTVALSGTVRYCDLVAGADAPAFAVNGMSVSCTTGNSYRYCSNLAVMASNGGVWEVWIKESNLDNGDTVTVGDWTGTAADDPLPPDCKKGIVSVAVYADRPHSGTEAPTHSAVRWSMYVTAESGNLPMNGATVSFEFTQDGNFLNPSSLGVKTYHLSSGGGTKVLTAMLVDDDIDEPDGSVSARLLPGDCYTIEPGRGTATYSVRDDDEIDDLNDTPEYPTAQPTNTAAAAVMPLNATRGPFPTLQAAFDAGGQDCFYWHGWEPHTEWQGWFCKQ